MTVDETCPCDGPDTVGVVHVEVAVNVREPLLLRPLRPVDHDFPGRHDVRNNDVLLRAEEERARLGRFCGHVAVDELRVREVLFEIGTLVGDHRARGDLDRRELRHEVDKLGRREQLAMLVQDRLRHLRSEGHAHALPRLTDREVVDRDGYYHAMGLTSGIVRVESERVEWPGHPSALRGERLDGFLPSRESLAAVRADEVGGFHPVLRFEPNENPSRKALVFSSPSIPA